MNQVVHQPPEGIPLATVCTALGLNRSSVYARRRAGGISEEERAQRRSRLTRTATARALGGRAPSPA